MNCRHFYNLHIFIIVTLNLLSSNTYSFITPIDFYITHKAKKKRKLTLLKDFSNFICRVLAVLHPNFYEIIIVFNLFFINNPCKFESRTQHETLSVVFMMIRMRLLLNLGMNYQKSRFLVFDLRRIVCPHFDYSCSISIRNIFLPSKFNFFE